MQKVLSLLFVVTIVGFLNAQPTKTIVNDANAELRTVSSFKNIEISGAITAYISQGKEGLAVSCTNPKYTDKIITKVEGNTLKIYIDKPTFSIKNFKERFKAYISVQNLEGIDISGASNVKMVDEFQLKTIKIDISGASSFKGDIFADNIKAEVSGASVVRLSGKTKYAVIDVGGASSVKASDLLIEVCKIHASGASSARINVNEKLEASASGASSIGYIGNIQNVQKHATGASTIKSLN
ncbi:MAG: DUF2807 domain-containing protein [Chitinophagaceae bacterium]|nr:DUF2807 domain-containing protein [Chitinophagaceae bacterium]MCW5904199.1 DUF2807 domain-containing protein [Chitinophagaceae bacterium]